MEQFMSTAKGFSADVFSDPAHRMSKRPLPIKSGEGLGFQELGSSFGPPKSVVTYGKSSKSKFKPAATFSANPRKAPLRISEDESDDELLLSSQNSMADDAIPSSRGIAKGKKPDTSDDDVEMVRVNGRILVAHPDYKPSSLTAIKGLRFTKTKKNALATDTATDAPPSSSLSNSQELSKPISDVIELLDDSPPRGLSSSLHKPSETSSTRSPSATRAADRRLTDTKTASTSKLSFPTDDDTPRPLAKPRPRPRVVIKSTASKRDSSSESTPLPAGQRRGIPLWSKTPEQPTNVDRKQTVKKPVRSSSRREPQEFPMSLQAKENVSDGAWSGDASSSKTKKIISRAATLVHTPKPNPLPSLLGTKQISRGTTFPDLSPLSSSNDKGKAREKTPDKDDTDLTNSRKLTGPKPFPMSPQMLARIERRSKSPRNHNLRSTKHVSSDDSSAEQGRDKDNTHLTDARKRAGPKPFPMSPQMLARIERRSKSPSIRNLQSTKRASSDDNSAEQGHGKDNTQLTDARKCTGPKPFPMSPRMLAHIERRSKSPNIRNLQSTKRASSDDSSAEQGRSAKKRKDSRSRVPDTIDYLHEADSIELGYARDPSKMCPYCDEDLPSHPTPLLQHLLTTARKKSVSDPRPRNRGGLKAPLTIYISVCQRHRFESHQLPIAAEKGWPKTIDFTKVPARVKKMKKALEAIILDKDDISDVEDLHTDDRSRGPKCKSVFWREVKKEVKKQGSRTVVGVKGQFASFEKAQPGYYGEQGSVIIHQTLFDLFPPSTIDASLIAPLSPTEFIQRILVPEAAVRLIAQDLGVDIKDAIVTLRESAQYGVAMFPDTGENKRKGGGVDDDEMDVADRIVMERARVRRRELAEEEKVEEEILEEERAAQRAKARNSRREKALERAQRTKESKAGNVEADTSDASETDAIRRTRRAVTSDSESDAMSVDSLASRRSVRIAKKGVRSDASKVVRAKPQVNSSDSDSMQLFGATRNRKSKTNERSMDHFSMKTIVAQERTKPFSLLTSLASDEEDKNTPRPARGRKTASTTVEAAVDGSDTRMLPLHTVRNRPDTSDPSARDSWSRSLRTQVPSGTDSDASNVSRRSQKLAPARMMTDEFRWLLPSQSDSP